MRNGAVIAIAVLACLMAVAAFLLFDRGGRAPPLDVPHDDAAPAMTAPAPVPEPPAGPGAGTEVRPIATTRFVEWDTQPARATRDEVLRVLVIDDATGFPVPGAEVAWRDAADTPEEFLGPFGAEPLISDPDGAPNRTVADARGLAWIPTSPRLVVCARLRDYFGLRKFETTPRGEIRLTVVAAPMVAARVVTPSGEPAAGVPVWFSITRKTGKSSRGSDWRVTSRAPDGLAIAHHPGVRAEDFQGGFVEVAAGLEGSARSQARVPFEKLKEGPIVLTLPAAGRVVVKLFDSEGAPLSAPAVVSLRSLPRKGERQLDLRSRTGAGVAEFHFVPLGTPLTVTARTDAFDSVVDQPGGELSSAGAELVVPVRFTTPRAVLAGRAIDESGDLLANVALDAEVVSGNGVLLLPAGTRIETGRDGTFKMVLDRNLSPLEPACDLELEMSSAPEVVERSAAVALPRLSESAETLLGDVRLAPPEPFASGVVVDEQGAPLGGALVKTASMRASPAGGTIVIGPRMRPLSERLRTRSGREGGFSIPRPARIRDRVRSFTLMAELDGYVCRAPTAPMEPGGRGARIVLHGTGVIEGRLLLPEPPPLRKLEVRVICVDAEGRREQRFEDCVDSEGNFRLPGLLPRWVTVTVRMAGIAEPLVVIPDVAVPRLGTAADARMRDIDLRDHPALRR